MGKISLLKADRFYGSFDCEAFSCHQGVEYRLLGAHPVARFSPAESRGIALVGFL